MSDGLSLNGPHPPPALVEAMFDRIAPDYDRFNAFASFGLDAGWRRAAARLLDAPPDGLVLDLGTGSGDLGREVALRGANVLGIDLARAMLRLARRKVDGGPERGPGGRVALLQADALKLPLSDRAADGACMAFGLRNVADLDDLFGEVHRVLKPGARFVSLEITSPENPVVRGLYELYFYRFMPAVASRAFREGDAFRYLAESVRRFERPASVAKRLERAGFRDVQVTRLGAGAVALHRGVA